MPFQIPLGALIPVKTCNLLAACKNIGTTHVSNGAYRLQPVEWAIGEAAGTLAAFCLSRGANPKQVWYDTRLTQALQTQLLSRGVPLAWTSDVPTEHPLFIPAQQLVMAGLITPDSPRLGSLALHLDKALSRSEAARLRQLGLPGYGAACWEELCATWPRDS